MNDDSMSKEEHEYKKAECNRVYPLIVAEGKRLNQNEAETRERCLEAFEYIFAVPWFGSKESTIEEIKECCFKKMKELGIDPKEAEHVGPVTCWEV